MIDPADEDDKVFVPFADGRYYFRFGLKQINEVQAKCGPFGEVFSRLLAGVAQLPDGSMLCMNEQARWRYEDIYVPIRQGMIGGRLAIVDGERVELTDHRIDEIMENYVHGRPISETWKIAVAAMASKITGFEPPKKKDPEPTMDQATNAPTSSGQMDMPEPSPTA